MKTSSRLASLAFALVFSPSCLLQAEPAPAGGEAGKLSPEMRQKLLEKFDQDGDGELDSREERAAKKARLEGGN